VTRKMPRDGAITFSSLICKRDMLHVSCAKCGRKGRYSMRRLIEDHGHDGKVTDLLAAVAADCPRKQSINMSDQCAACCPDARSRVVTSLGRGAVRLRI
jgi:hypothetical protein